MQGNQQQKNLSDIDKAETLAKAFFELMRLNLLRSSIDTSYPSDYEEDIYKNFCEQVKEAENELCYRFKEATGITLYRVGSDFFINGVSV